MEIWKDIKDFEELYEISNYGRVKAKNRLVKTKTGQRIYKERILKPETVCGYLRVVLSKNNKHFKFLIHRLVASHFLNNFENKREVNHKDGNKLNNNVGNLEWATSSENQKHAYLLGLQTIDKIKEANSTPIIMYDKYTNEIIDEFNSMMDCYKLTGYNPSIISYHCNNKTIPRNFDIYFRFK